MGRLGIGRGAGEGAVPPQHQMWVVEQRAQAVLRVRLLPEGVCRVQGGFPEAFLVSPGAVPCPMPTIWLLSLSVAVQRSKMQAQVNS